MSSRVYMQLGRVCVSPLFSSRVYLLCVRVFHVSRMCMYMCVCMCVHITPRLLVVFFFPLRRN